MTQPETDWRAQLRPSITVLPWKDGCKPVSGRILSGVHSICARWWKNSCARQREGKHMRAVTESAGCCVGCYALINELLDGPCAGTTITSCLSLTLTTILIITFTLGV